MANGMMGNPMGAQQSPMEQPMNNQGMQMGGADDSVLDMHLTQDVKQALQAKGIDISAVAERGPKEPVIVIPVSIILQRYPSNAPEESMKQFVMDMTKQNSAPSPMAAEAPSPDGLGAPTMDRPPMTA
jgi:pyruvate/2-oxoglutarate dehydrogenase complex dihydrolipoamide acyltransferase (E2) component|tara:strand:- start:2 stop:385 length:384 start_codon:yes stop_codon:yes gene_type:complete